MMSFEVARTDTDGAVRKAAKAREAALGITAENVLADCVRYVPIDTGALRDSGEAEVAANGKKATVSWGTTPETAEYARPVYYDETKAHQSPTRSRWFDYVRSSRQAAWQGMFKAALEARL